MSNSRSGRWLRVLVLASSFATAHGALAQQEDALAALINAYRSQPQRCAGERRAAVGPLAPAAALRLGIGGALQDQLQAHGYRAAHAQEIALAGPAGAAEAMGFLQQRYCRELLDPRFSDIGVTRQGRTWRIVFARPLLSPQLGAWEQAGREVLRLTNVARSRPRTCGEQRHGPAPPVEWSPTLGAAALAHSRDMAGHNEFRHSGTDGSRASERATRAGYRWRSVGENIATGQGSPEQVVAGWLASPGHCANIMNAGFSEMGAAYAVNPGTDTVIFWTQVFGAPRS